MGNSKPFLECLKCKSYRTLPVSRVAAPFREPGILTGYRPPDQTWTYYVTSVLKLHNETGNIWTHAVPSVYLTYKLISELKTYNETGDDKNWILSMFIFCGLVKSVLSSTAHTFHSKSTLLHYLFYQGDYAGIAIMGLGKSILFLHTSSSDTYFYSFFSLALPIYVILAWTFMLGNCVGQVQYQFGGKKLLQVSSVVLQAFVGGLPIFAKYINCLQDSDCKFSSLNHHSIWFLTLLGALFFFASHLPEVKHPGYFDYVGQGHQIFHILTSTTVILEIQAVSYDMDIDGCKPINKGAIIAALIVAIAGCGVIMTNMLHLTKQRARLDIKFKKA